jgi:2-polyprenyl-3-methyl-5-hydroxy-6-metoxy-1,4-benzoquinol methylase
MKDYRHRFYDGYRSTCVEHRDAGGTVEAHARRFAIWDRLIAPHLPAGHDAAILDCGCGEGYLLSWLLARGYYCASGIDASMEEVLVAQKLGLPVQHREILPALLSHSQSLDFIIFRNVLEHFSKEEVMETLLTARRALRPRGGIWIQAPNAESPFGARHTPTGFHPRLDEAGTAQGRLRVRPGRASARRLYRSARTVVEMFRGVVQAHAHRRVG